MNYSTLLRRSVDFEPYAEGQFGDVIEEALCDQANQIPQADVTAFVIAHLRRRRPRRHPARASTTTIPTSSSGR